MRFPIAIGLDLDDVWSDSSKPCVQFTLRYGGLYSNQNTIRLLFILSTCVHEFVTLLFYICLPESNGNNKCLKIQNFFFLP